MKVTVIDGYNLTTTIYNKVIEIQTLYNDGIPELEMDQSLIIIIIYINALGEKVKKAFNPKSSMSFITQEETT